MALFLVVIARKDGYNLKKKTYRLNLCFRTLHTLKKSCTNSCLNKRLTYE